jgi:hypothetical protein
VQWLTSVIPATQDEEIRRIVVQDQLRQKVSKISISSKKLAMVVCAYGSSYVEV